MKNEEYISHFHMTLSDRIVIEQSLREGKTFCTIADELHRDPSTIAKEIKRVVNACDFKSDPVDCIYVRNCRITNLCKENECSAYCKDCGAITCTKTCHRWKPSHCEKLLNPPYVCNACPTAYRCHLSKKYYRAKDAQRLYEKKKSDSRKGINMTKQELDRLNQLVSPLILQHQSLSHIYATHADEIQVSRATLYKYIALGVLDAKTMDLPRKVRYKKRKKIQAPKKLDYKYRSGRTYRHFENYLGEHPDAEVVEMDTVKGGNKKGPCLLTMLWRSSGLMLLFLLPSCTMAAVVSVFDELYDCLGASLFSAAFPVILTDNGSEFKDSSGIETAPDGKLRTHLFYCDPQQTNQKSRLERNHEFIRYIIPKGVGMYWLTKEQVFTMMMHINSVKRDSLNGHSPFEVAQMLMKKEVLDLLHITCVPPDQVQLNPALLKK